MNSIETRVNDPSRRSFVRKAVYAAPLILTLKAVPSFASSGSGQGPTPESPDVPDEC